MITLKEKIGYGFGDMASSMFWKLFGSYLLIFYTDVFGLPAAAIGTMFLATRVFDSFLDPCVGMIADRTSSKWGKFRPYILYLAIPFGLFGFLTFLTPDFSYSGKLAYAYITYTLMMIIYSGINVPYASLLGVISPEPKERNTLSTFRMAFAYIGSFLSLLLFKPMANYFSKGHSEQYGWSCSVAIISIFCVILFFLCFSWTKERVVSNEKNNSLKSDLKDLLHNKPWWILLGAGISALIFNSIRDGAAVYYFKYYVVEETYADINILGIPFVLSGLYLAIGQVANIIGVVLAAPVSNRIGKRSTYFIAMLLATILSIAFFWIGKDKIALIFIFQILISICAGSIFPLLWSMYADCSDYSEYKTGNRATGLIFSSSSMSQKFGWAIGSAITGWLLSHFGFRANEVQSPETINGIKLFLSWLPAIGSLASLILVRFYPLSENAMKDICEKLKIQRER